MTTTNTINNAVERHNQRMAAISAKHEAELEQKRKAQEKERSEKIRHTNAQAVVLACTGGKSDNCRFEPQSAGYGTAFEVAFAKAMARR